jgi:hypothetical protein
VGWSERIEVDASGDEIMKRQTPTVKEGRKRAPIFGCMKDLFTIEEGYDLTSPMELEPDWDRKYYPE